MGQEEIYQQQSREDFGMGCVSASGRYYKRFIEALRDARFDFWFVQDFRPGIFACFDPDLNLTFANDVYARSFNKQPHEMVGVNALTLIPPFAQPYLMQVLGYLNQKYPVCIIELEMPVSDEGSEWVRWTIRAVYNAEATLIEYQGHWEDITGTKTGELKLKHDHKNLEALVESKTAELHQEIAQRKIIEEELFRKEKLESLSILASGIAHDFNNILTIISGNNSLANIILEEKGDYDVCELLDEVQRGVTQAQELTEQLMTFSRGGIPVKEAVSMEDLIQESAGFVLHGSNVRAVFSSSGQIWPADIDRGQIGQVFHNLILNAAQAMPRGGIIEIYISNIMPEIAEALALNAGRYVQVVIKDHGTGISSEDLGNIFVPYFSTKDKGHGLGLAMAYSIIKKHDGKIKVSSESGIGTTFEVYLPASDDIIIDKGSVTKVNFSGQGRILVMDDDRTVRNTLGRMLRQLGYEADLARDGQDTIQMYVEAREAGTPYHAVIMDLTVAGGMGAQETMQKLKKLDDKIKAVVSSGYSADEVLVNHRNYGFCGMLEKPIEIDRLSRVLFEAVGPQY